MNKTNKEEDRVTRIIAVKLFKGDKIKKIES